MIDWSAYDSRLTTHGKTQSDRTAYREKQRLERKAPASLSFKEVKIGPIDGLEDGNDETMLITSTQQRYAKTINMMPNHDFDVGSIVYWNESRWLITQKDVEDAINKKGGMELCSAQKLRWQNPVTKEIHERWITTNKPYFNNLEDIRQAEISTREYKIQVKSDRETQLLGLNKRFLMEVIDGEPKSYRLTSNDTLTKQYAVGDETKGFLILNVEQDQYNPATDDPDLMICDYIPSTPPPPPPSDTHIEFQYDGDPEIKQGVSRGKEFVAVVFDADGQPVFGAIADLSINMPPDLQEHITISPMPLIGNKVKLVAGSKAPIGGVARITATFQDVDPVYIDVKVVSMI